MKPVVTSPAVPFRQLLDELEQALQSAVEPEAVEHLVEQILGKLQRKKRRMSAEALDRFTSVAGHGPTELVRTLRERKPEEVLAFFRAHPPLLSALDRSGPGQLLFVSDSADEVTQVYRGYGKKKRPDDYLEEFAAYIRDNQNEIPALQAVVQRPRDLTRKSLKELELILSERGYTETNVRKAWSETRNEDIAARIIGFIRQAALGDPLIDYSERVDRAVRKILAQRSFTEVQKRWLQRLAKALKADAVVDRETLDQGQWRADGGFARFNKLFDGQLEALLGDLREAIWEAG